jgi:hypothetical protein
MTELRHLWARPGHTAFCCVFAAVSAALLLMPTKLARADSGGAPMGTQATSSFALREQDGGKAIDITNVTFETTSTYVPGRPAEERLLLRTTARSRQVIDEEGLEASVTVEAWPLGTDPAATPLYTVTLDGVGVTVEDSAVLVFDRGTEDVDWWSVHGLGTGSPLFDSHVPVLRLSLSREVQTLRYVGFDVPPDDATDPRLREPHVVGILAYASAERVIRRLLVSCSDPKRAAELRSYWDTERVLSLEEKGAAAKEPAQTLHLRWSAFYPSPPKPVTVSIPIVADDLDTTHAKLPACMAVAPWSP